MTPLISVIVPVRNAARSVETMVDRLGAQDYRPIQVVFVDGGSTDGTLELLKRICNESTEPDFQILVLEQSDYGRREGIGHARNVGVNAAKGDFVVFLDSDMFFLQRDSLSRISRELERVPFTAVKTQVLVDSPLEEYLSKGYPKFHHCAFRRDVFEKVNFDPSLGFGEDRDLWFRLKSQLGFDLDHTVDVTIARHLPASLAEYSRQTFWYGRTMPRFFLVVFARGEVDYLKDVCGWMLYMRELVYGPLLFVVAVRNYFVTPFGSRAPFVLHLWEYVVRRVLFALAFVLGALESRCARFMTRVFVECTTRRDRLV